jgi:hypothetical protein
MELTKKARAARIIIAAMLTVAMMILLLPAGVQTANASESIKLGDPNVVEETPMEAYQKTTWDCVWFGSYPQKEVVADESSYNAIFKGGDGELGFYNEETDVIEDKVLFAKLESATGWDDNGDITIDGSKYRRIKKADATQDEIDIYYYAWDDSDSYHYFKYEPIKWRVLSVDGTDAFLLADKALDDKMYNTKTLTITWEKCTLRSWLNGYTSSENESGIDYNDSNFINTAFSSSEVKAIKTSTITNSENTYYRTNGGNETEDKIFLLSENEVYNTDAACSYGFVLGNSTDEARFCQATTYAKAMGTYNDTDSAENSDYLGNCRWWLRSPGYITSYAAVVDYDSDIDSYGRELKDKTCAVRPALHIDLSQADLWSYAGTYCSDETYGIEHSKVSVGAMKYDGSQKRPAVTVTYEGKKLAEGIDYTVGYNVNKAAGNGQVTIYGKGIYFGELVKTFTIDKARNTLSVKGKTAKIKLSKVKKKARKIKRAKVLNVKNAKGKVTYKKAFGNKKIKINKKSGKVTVKKGLKKGTYKVRIKVAAAGDTNYSSIVKKVTFKIKVK